MAFGSFLRTHAKNIRAAKAEKANGQAIHQIDKDIEGEAQLDIYQGEDYCKRIKWEPKQVAPC